MSYIENEVRYEAAIRRNIRNNALKTFMKRDRAQEVVSWLNNARGEFAQSLASAFNNYGKLTDKQFAAVLRIIDTAPQRKAEWEAKRIELAAKSAFVGAIGSKISLKNVKVESVITTAARRFSYYDRAEQEVYLLRDEAGNRLVFRTKANVELAKGDTVNLTAKVKNHTVFRDEAQTVISYAKFAKVEA